MPASDQHVARPPAYRGLPYLRVALFLLVVIAYRQWFVEGLASARLANTWLYYSILVLGFYFVFGIAGQFAFSQAAFAGLGGFTSAWATRNDEPFIVGLLAAAFVCAALAVAFSLVMRRTNHFYFAIGTLGLSEILIILFKSWEELTGPSGGYITDVKPISLFGYAFDTDYRAFWVLLALVGLVLIAGYAIARSPVQREAIANRDGSLVAATNGVPTLAIRIKTLTLGSAIAGVAGSVLVHWSRGAQVDSFGVDLALGIFLMLILGGIGSLWGAVLGAWFYVYIQDWLRNADWVIFGHGVNEMWPIVYGSLLVVIMVVLPDGLIGLGRRFHRTGGPRSERESPSWLTARLRGGRGVGTVPADGAATPATPAASSSPVPATGNGAAPPALPALERDDDRPPIGDPVLTARDITVDFGAVRAVDNVGLTLHEHQILGLIGPNGSGKSSFLNALSGVVPARGKLEIDEVPDRRRLAVRAAVAAFCLAPAVLFAPPGLWVTAVAATAAGLVVSHVRRRQDALGDPQRVRRAGVLRTYQTPQTFLNLTCIENVLVATSDRRATGLTSAWLLRPLMLRRERERWAKATATLARFGLGDRAEAPAAGLSYGQQRLLELARVVAADPRIILLDEPSAGLNANETAALARHLGDLRDEGISLVLVDHKVDFISALCDRVLVLELGALVAEGDPDTIWADERVVDAYLGIEDLRDDPDPATASASEG